MEHALQDVIFKAAIKGTPPVQTKRYRTLRITGVLVGDGWKCIYADCYVSLQWGRCRFPECLQDPWASLCQQGGRKFPHYRWQVCNAQFQCVILNYSLRTSTLYKNDHNSVLEVVIPSVRTQCEHTSFLDSMWPSYHNLDCLMRLPKGLFIWTQCFQWEKCFVTHPSHSNSSLDQWQNVYLVYIRMNFPYLNYWACIKTSLQGLLDVGKVNPN